MEAVQTIDRIKTAVFVVYAPSYVSFFPLLAYLGSLLPAALHILHSRLLK